MDRLKITGVPKYLSPMETLGIIRDGIDIIRERGYFPYSIYAPERIILVLICDESYLSKRGLIIVEDNGCDVTCNIQGNIFGIPIVDNSGSDNADTTMSLFFKGH